LRQVHPNGIYIESVEQQTLMAIQRIERDHLLLRSYDKQLSDGGINKRRRIRAQKMDDTNALYNIRFKENRVPIRMEQQALLIVKQQKLAKFMFPAVAPIEKEMEIVQ
jgi:sulfate adenylyltransferase subunit 1 (EFTu-like GTPase family)